MHCCVDNQLTNSSRRDFINILSIQAFNYSAKMNITQYKMISIFNNILHRPCKFTPIYKNNTPIIFKHSTLESTMQNICTGKYSVSICRHKLSFMLNQNTPRHKLLCCNVLHQSLFLIAVAIAQSYLFHLSAKLFYISITYLQTKTDSFIKKAIIAFKQQFLYHCFIR